MKSNLSIENKVDDALNSVDSIHRAEPLASFYAKVMAKIRHAQPAAWEKWSAFLLRPTIAIAIICLVIVMNVFVIYSNLVGSFALDDQTELTLTDEYSMTASLYDIENATP